MPLSGYGGIDQKLAQKMQKYGRIKRIGKLREIRNLPNGVRKTGDGLMMMKELPACHMTNQEELKNLEIVYRMILEPLQYTLEVQKDRTLNGLTTPRKL
jgi:hypothetical protein